MFQKEKPLLTDFLNDKHKINDISIECIIKAPSEEEQSKYIINPKEKFYHMKKINPELENLRKKLDLRPEI